MRWSHCSAEVVGPGLSPRIRESGTAGIFNRLPHARRERANVSFPLQPPRSSIRAHVGRDTLHRAPVRNKADEPAGNFLDFGMRLDRDQKWWTGARLPWSRRDPRQSLRLAPASRGEAVHADGKPPRRPLAGGGTWALPADAPRWDFLLSGPRSENTWGSSRRR